MFTDLHIGQYDPTSIDLEIASPIATDLDIAQHVPPVY